MSSTPDLDEYQSSRGMYIANRDLPGPVVHHIEDVITAIKQKVYDDDSVKKNINILNVNIPI